MDNNIIESLKGKSREERMEFFNSNSKETLFGLSADELSNVNGGDGAKLENPDSEGIYKGNYYTSWGYVCGISRC